MAPNHRGRVVFRLNPQSGGLDHLSPDSVVIQQVMRLSHESINVSHGKENPGYSVLDQFSISWDVGSQDRHAGLHGFEDHIGLPLVKASIP
jgi:hypothetical protein